MEFDVVEKLLVGLASVLGTIAVILLNSKQADKVKAELLEKFETAVEKSQKHSVTELFRLIHGVRMSYADILELIKHNECSKIIYAIKKTPGIVCYKNGAFSYTGIGRNSAFRSFDRWITKFGIAFFSFFTLIALLMLVFGRGATSIIGFISLFFGAVMLALQLRQRNYNLMVANLIDSDDNDPIQPHANAASD